MFNNGMFSPKGIPKATINQIQWFTKFEVAVPTADRTSLELLTPNHLPPTGDDNTPQPYLQLWGNKKTTHSCSYHKS